MSIAVVSANDILTSTKVNEIINRVNAVAGSFALKTGDEIVNNSAAYQSDDELTVAVASSRIYVGHLHVNFVSSTVANFRLRLAGPAGATSPAWVLSGPSLAATLDISMFTGTAGIPGTGSTEPLDAWGVIIMSTTAGTVTCQWAQSSVEVSDTTVKAGSFLFLQEVG